MDSYCEYNNAFCNKDNDNLDRMAREINNKRKTLQKQVEHNFDDQYKEINKGLNYLMKQENSRYAPSNFNYISANNNNDYESGLPSIMDNNDFKSGLPSIMDNQKNSDNNTIDSTFTSKSKYTFNSLPISSFPTISESPVEMINMDSDMSSTYSILPANTKKHLRLNTSHLKKYGENDDDKILSHMKKCNQCRLQLLHLLSENNICNNKNKINKNINTMNTTTGILNISVAEVKDILILILIGIFIIILLDFFLR